MATVNYKAGECVFRQGDPATSVYLVTKGEWEVGTEKTQLKRGDSGTGLLPQSSDEGSSSDAKRYDKPLRIVAHLGPGDHFGETALLEERNKRNTTVRCTSPICELKEMDNERFSKFLQESQQLSDSVYGAAVNRNNRRVRKVIAAAEAAGKASTVTLEPGQVLFQQGDRSGAFYLVESGTLVSLHLLLPPKPHPTLCPLALLPPTRHHADVPYPCGRGGRGRARRGAGSHPRTPGQDGRMLWCVGPHAGR